MRRSRQNVGNCRFVEMLESRRLMAASYYVATSGSDSNPGTSTLPFKTIQKAANLAAAGDVITVRSGNYAGFSVGYNFAQNGTASSPITFKADPGVTITSRNAITADGIDVERCNYIVIDGFKITNDGSITRAGIRFAGGGVGDVIRNNVVQMNPNDNYGIYTSFSQNLLVENNDVSGTNNAAIYTANSAVSPTVRGNVVHNTGAIGMHFNGDAEQGGAGVVTGALVENNIAYECGTVQGGGAINFDGVQNSRIQNNLLYNNHGRGITLYTVDASAGCINNVIANNTIVQASNANDYALALNYSATGCTIYNNILFTSSTNGGSFRISADSLPGLISDYNVVQNRMSYDNGNSSKSLATWQSVTGQDAHSIVSTSVATFVNAALNDFRLLATSPAIDAGTNMASPKQAPTIDLVGTPRPNGARYDIGAYERISVDLTPPTVTSGGFIYATSPNKITIGFSEDVSASLSAADLTVRSNPGNAPVSITGYSYNNSTNVATFNLQTPIADGNYRATLGASGVTDAGGNRLGADYTYDFFILAGDANHDRKVDITDLSILTTNWQGAGKTFLQGDFNYDTKVDALDLGQLSHNWQRTLAPATSAAPISLSISTPTRTARRLIDQV